jgi:Txe/YoeB family toxin of Txe-Axe toxin-antitoxin module
MSWGIVYYKARDGSVPAEAFLDACPLKVEATILAVLEAVRQAPPPQFSGGGKWEAMHGTMAGYYEIRVTGPARAQYRLFCRLENGMAGELAARGFHEPQIGRHHGHVQALPHCVQRPRVQDERAGARGRLPGESAAPHRAVIRACPADVCDTSSR